MNHTDLLFLEWLIASAIMHDTAHIWWSNNIERLARLEQVTKWEVEAWYAMKMHHDANMISTSCRSSAALASFVMYNRAAA